MLYTHGSDWRRMWGQLGAINVCIRQAPLFDDLYLRYYYYVFFLSFFVLYAYICLYFVLYINDAVWWMKSFVMLQQLDAEMSCVLDVEISLIGSDSAGDLNNYPHRYIYTSVEII